jgi:hypothetical protein
MALTAAERLAVQALIINDLTPFAGADIAAILADTATIAWGDVTAIDTVVDAIKTQTDVMVADTPYLADAALPVTPTAGSIGALVKTNLDAAISSRASAADYTAARAGYLDNINQAGLLQLTVARAGYLDNLSAGAAALEATLTAIKGAGWTTETLKAIKDAIAVAQADLDNPNQYKADVSALALASVCTEDRLSKLDAAISSRLAAASYVTERGTDNAALASVCTEARLARLDADVSSRLASASFPDSASYTAARAAKIDNLDAAISSRLAAASYTPERGTDNAYLQATAELDWAWNCLVSDSYRAITGSWALTAAAGQYLGVYLGASSPALNDEISLIIRANSTNARTINIRGITDVYDGIVTVTVDGTDLGTIDWYSLNIVYNVVKTIAWTPVRIGPHAMRLKVTSKNAGSAGYRFYISEMWLS